MEHPVKNKLAGRESTVLWSGEVAVLGGGIAGITAACASVRDGLKTILIEPGPVLGREVSMEWADTLPDCLLKDSVLKLCDSQGARNGVRMDIFTATLAFDKILLDSGAEALVCVLPVRPLAGSKGFLAGIEVVGKSGRQAVLAKTVIDSTPGRIFSRNVVGAGKPEILSAVRRMRLHGVEHATIGDIVFPSSLGINALAISPAIWKSEILLSFKMYVSADMAKAEIMSRSQRLAIELVAWLRQNNPGFSEASLVDISPTFRPEYNDSEIDFKRLDLTGLHVLPIAPDISTEISLTEKMLADRPWRGKVSTPVPGNITEDIPDIIESSELKAAAEQDLPSIKLPPARCFVHPEKDIVVAGCGTGGSLAAIAAAEEGGSVTVLEPAEIIGGAGTAGRVHSYYYGLPGGIQERIDGLVEKESLSICRKMTGFHPVSKVNRLFCLLRENKVELLVGHIVFGLVKEGRCLQAILSASEDGYHIFPCRVAIDGTGDGDLAAASGAEYRFGREGDGFVQPFSYIPSMVSDGRLRFSNFDIGWVDPTDAIDFSRAHFEGRRVLWGFGPFSDGNHYCTLASSIGIRESRFIQGETILTFEEFLDGEKYDDAVCECHAHYDNHSVDYAEESRLAHHYTAIFGLWGELLRGEVPYRSMLSGNTANLLMACRALSVDHDMHQLLRMQRDIQKIGEIAGIAAAISVRNKTSPDSIDIDELRGILFERGILPEKKAEPKFDLPAEELLKLLGTDKSGIAIWRLSRLRGNARPDWNQFFKSEKDQRRLILGAIAAAPSGETEPAALQILRKVATEPPPFTPLGHMAPEIFIAAALALAEAGDPQAAGLLEKNLLECKIDSATTILLVLKGMEETGSKSCIIPVREFLKRTEGEEFPVRLPGGKSRHMVSFRFHVLARAIKTLTSLGCTEETFRLNPYLNDRNLVFRRYARRLVKHQSLPKQELK
jgi:hypothetical protein